MARGREAQSPNHAPSSLPLGPLAEVVTRAESVPAEAPGQQHVANANEEAATSNPPPAIEKPVGEVSLGVTVKTLRDELFRLILVLY